jgi:hypothetical protein
LPELEPAAYQGPIGDWVAQAAVYTEVDPAALLLSALVCFGVAAGSDRFMMAGNRPQRARLFVMLVAGSAKANRGLSWAVTRDLLAVINPALARDRVLTGLGSGRPLVEALIADERLIVFEPAVTRALSVAARPTSPLTWALRNAWDGAPIELGGRSRKVTVEHHHVGVIAHATADQLRAQLSITDASASLVNRFVYALIRRARVLPDEGNVPPDLIARHGRRLAEAANAARGVAQVRRTPSAERRWRGIYEELAEDDPDGLLGIAVARSARHVLRLSLIYALADRAQSVGDSHVEAATALWRFARASAVHVLGEQRTDDIVGRLLGALHDAGSAGLTLTEQAALFGRNVPAARLAQARRRLEEDGLAVTSSQRRAGSGRLPTVTQLVDRRRA